MHLLFVPFAFLLISIFILSNGIVGLIALAIFIPLAYLTLEYVYFNHPKYADMALVVLTLFFLAVLILVAMWP